MSKITPEIRPLMRFFMKIEDLKENLMKQGYTKQQALELVKEAVTNELPNNMVVDIENDCICIRNIGDTVERRATTI